MQKVEKNKKDIEYYKECVKKFVEGKVLVIGDLMLDTYLIGDSTRISPEAPIPIVKIEESKEMLGGAGNVARSIVALNGSVSIFGVTGVDDEALRMKKLFSKENIASHFLSLPDRVTTIKTRVLARGQQMLRMDRETSDPLEKKRREEFLYLLENELKNFDVVVISDYAKGLITEELMDYLRSFKNAKNEKLKILADPKPENKDLYKELFLLTPNQKETFELSHKKVTSLEEVKEAGHSLKQELKLNNILTTLGPQGMALFSEKENKEEIWHIPTTAQQVFDVTGAGDTVIATIALALSVGINLLDACVLANYAAGIVVGKVGSATASQEELFLSIEQNLI